MYGNSSRDIESKENGTLLLPYSSLKDWYRQRLLISRKSFYPFRNPIHVDSFILKIATCTKFLKLLN